MSTIDRICELLKEQGKMQKDLTDYLGVSKNHFTDWKSGRIKSYMKHLPQIADFFGVSVDFLLGKEDNLQKEISPTADGNEAVKVALFGGDTEVTDEMWNEVMNYAEFLKQKYKKD